MATHKSAYKKVNDKNVAASRGPGIKPPVPAIQLQDNREKFITQKKQIDALNGVASEGGIVQKKENNTGLPANLKTGIENLSGIAMNDVKVHYNSAKPAQLNAHAYAQGANIHVAPGQEKHLPHEAWHVVQQKQGRVKPTLQMKTGVPVNDDKGLEQEADIMGRKALQLKAINNTAPATNTFNSFIVQKEEKDVEHKPLARFIVEDHSTIAKGQITKTGFLNALNADVTQVANEVLAKIHQTSANCPYISYWFKHYESKDLNYIEKALSRYAPGSMSAGSWQQCIHLVVAKVKASFQLHVNTGNLDGVPDGIPKELPGEEIDTNPSATETKEGVAQLCSSSESNGGKDDDAEAHESKSVKQSAGTSSIVPPGAGSGKDPLTPSHEKMLAGLATKVKQGEIKAEYKEPEGPAGPHRTRREEDDGKLFDEAKLERMLAWIEEVKDLIKGAHYKAAFKKMTNKKEAAGIGIHLDLHEQRRSDGDALAAAEKNLSDGGKGTIHLNVPENIITEPDIENMSKETEFGVDEEKTYDWLNTPKLAAKVLPMHLEEYMHQYQARSNKFMSHHTGNFKKTGQLPDFAERGKEGKLALKRSDFDEIDILAKLHEWGFNVEEIDYVSRYKERGKFWEWLAKSGRR